MRARLFSLDGPGLVLALALVGAALAPSLTAEADWRGARWVGAGHGEFRGRLAIPTPQPSESSGCDAEEVQARAFVSAPGGALLRVNGALVGTDEIGVAPWLDWTKAMHVRVLDLSAHLRRAAGTSNIRRFPHSFISRIQGTRTQMTQMHFLQLD